MQNCLCCDCFALTPGVDDIPNKFIASNFFLPSAEETSNGDLLGETAARKQIEIQSACQWKQDSNMILGALFGRMKQNQLSQRFMVGPYHIHPIAKIFLRKPSGSLIKYRVGLPGNIVHVVSPPK